MIIVYCERCGMRVPEEDQARGASPDGAKVFCSNCAPVNILKKPTPDFVPLVFKRRTPAAGVPIRRPAAPEPNPANFYLKVAACLGLILGVIGIIMICVSATRMQSTENSAELKVEAPEKPKSFAPAVLITPPAPVALDKPATAVPAPTSLSGSAAPAAQAPIDTTQNRRNQYAAHLLDEAKQWGKDHSDDVATLRDRFTEIAVNHNTTPAAAEAAEQALKLKVPALCNPSEAEAWKNAIDLMPLIDPKKDAVCGEWTAQYGEVASGRSGVNRIEIPYQPPEEYDFRIVFTRKDGNQDVVQHFSENGKQLMWAYGMAQNTFSAFEIVGGRQIGARRDKWIENGKCYTSVVQVRKDRVRAFLDGQLIVDLPIDYKTAGLRNEWKLRNTNVLGLGTHCGRTVFRRIELLEISGKGKTLR